MHTLDLSTLFYFLVCTDPVYYQSNSKNECWGGSLAFCFRAFQVCQINGMCEIPTDEVCYLGGEAYMYIVS